MLKRTEEAAEEAQTAVGLDGANSSAQFMLGILLARRLETRALCESYLIYTSRTLPEAHYFLAWVYSWDGAPQSDRGDGKVLASRQSKERLSPARRP